MKCYNASFNQSVKKKHRNLFDESYIVHVQIENNSPVESLTKAQSKTFVHCIAMAFMRSIESSSYHLHITDQNTTTGITSYVNSLFSW